jgi:hypothetical protein
MSSSFDAKILRAMRLTESNEKHCSGCGEIFMVEPHEGNPTECPLCSDKRKHEARESAADGDKTQGEYMNQTAMAGRESVVSAPETKPNEMPVEVDEGTTENCPQCKREMPHSTLGGDDYHWCPVHGREGKEQAKESYTNSSFDGKILKAMRIGESDTDDEYEGDDTCPDCNGTGNDLADKNKKRADGNCAACGGTGRND